MTEREPYKSFNYHSLFHALSHLYESRTSLSKLGGTAYDAGHWEFDLSTAQLAVGDEIQHCIDVAISGNSTGTCAYCESPVYVHQVRGWQISVPLTTEHKRIHKRYGVGSVAINPICYRHSDLEFEGVA